MKPQPEYSLEKVRALLERAPVGDRAEDYSDDGNAWSYFSHDQARSRAYHWGEDGLAGICDDRQRLCFALALWNGRDPIIKERLFGLTYPTLGDLYKHATYAAMLKRDGLVVDDSVNEAKIELAPTNLWIRPRSHCNASCFLQALSVIKLTYE